MSSLGFLKVFSKPHLSYDLQYYSLFSYKNPYLDVSFIRCKGEVTTKLNYKVITKAIIIDKKSFSLNETKIKSPLFRAGEKFQAHNGLKIFLKDDAYF